MSKVVIFTFAGRRANLELQLPFIRRILAEHSRVEYHIWDLSRTLEDHLWLRTIEGDRIVLHNEFYGSKKPHRRFKDVYSHYTHPVYRDTVFVKIDDDIVFIEVGRFDDLIAAVRANPDAIVSANVINNGACALLDARLCRDLPRMDSVPLEAYLSAEFARVSHEYFFKWWAYLLEGPVTAYLVDDWLSINFIGYTWDMGRKLHDLLQGPTPDVIAGFPFGPSARMGDEGAVNLLPRVILSGMMAAHLTYGPQDKQMTADELDGLRKRYADIGDAGIYVRGGRMLNEFRVACLTSPGSVRTWAPK